MNDRYQSRYQSQHQSYHPSSRQPTLPNLPPVTPPRPPGRPKPARAAAAERAGTGQTWRKIRQVLKLAFGAVFVLLIVGVFLVQRQASAVADAIVVPEVRPNPPAASPLFGSINVLIIGVDERPDHPEEGVRSDTLILAHVKVFRPSISLLSIPRDTQVELQEVGTTKINVAYGLGYERATEWYGPEATPQQGGMSLASQTVERFLGYYRGTRVDYTAQVNFDGFVGLIDALGGVTIEVPAPLVDDAYPTPDYGIMRVEFQPGVQRMDGATALIYARTRHADSDFGRSQRQQQVMQAIAAEIQRKGWVERVRLLPAVAKSLEGRDGQPPPVLTTLPIDRLDMLLGGVLLARGLGSEAIRSVPLNPETVEVMEIGSNLLWDEAGVRARVDEWLR
ncbi:MAG: LCP family protein [Chloroflexaceae bacterium]|nr:LCP family protein [Chloroflexaceae bacterium]